MAATSEQLLNTPLLKAMFLPTWSSSKVSSKKLNIRYVPKRKYLPNELKDQILVIMYISKPNKK